MTPTLSNWLAADGPANVEARLETQLRTAQRRVKNAQERAKAARQQLAAEEMELERIERWLGVVRGREAAA